MRIRGTLLRTLFATTLSVFVTAPLTFASSTDDLNQFLFNRNDGIHTDAFLVIQNGETLFESYSRGFGIDKKHISWSMAKTFGGILIGNAIDEGKMALNDPIAKYLPVVKTQATLHHVLNMSSGIHFREEYAGVPVNSDATKMLYLNGPETGFAAYTASCPTRDNGTPGQYFYYSSGDANLLMGALNGAIGNQKDYDAYPWKKIFTPLGIENATFEQDSAQTFVGSSYVYLTARDFAKMGTLLMNEGKAGDTQVIPNWYFNLMNQVAPGVEKEALNGTDPARSYSMQITTNHPIAGRNLLSQYPDLPEDALLMIGHQGQLVIGSPSQKLVIVRLAMDNKDNLNRQELFKLVRAFLVEHNHSVSVARDLNRSAYQTYSNPEETPEAGKAKMLEYLKVPRLIRALAAKEYCSCIHVEQRTDEQCKEDLKTMLPILPRLKVEKDGSVEARLGVGFSYEKAIFRGNELGCTLVGH